MLTLRSAWALAAALAAACSFSAPTPAASNICRSTYSYAGITAPDRANGISAALTAVSVPNVVEGHVAGWIGVGGPGLGPGGSDEWIQIGLSAFPESGSIMYYEVDRAGGFQGNLADYVNSCIEDAHKGRDIGLAVVERKMIR